MRRWLNNNPVVASVLVVAFITFWVVVLVMRLTGDDGRQLAPPQKYFYDIETGELFLGPTTTLGPIDAPSGEGNGYVAYVFSCGQCSDESKRFVAWMEKPAFQPEEVSGEAPPNEEDIYTWVRTPDMGKDEWVASNSPQGMAIVAKVVEPCPETNRRPNACHPPRRYVDD